MRKLVLTAILLLSCSSSLNAAPPAKDSHASRAPENATAVVEAVFSKDEIRIIRDYYGSHAFGHAPNKGKVKGKGKHKQKSLPPGIAKNLARGKPLPPGIAKRSLPYDLSRQLPRPRSGYEIIVVTGKVLLIEIATPQTSMHDLYCAINQSIEDRGYRNLDFRGNLGHSIEKHLDDRRFIEGNNQDKLGDCELFTFEPHICGTDGLWGFKRENIYYFEDGKAKPLGSPDLLAAV